MWKTYVCYLVCLLLESINFLAVIVEVIVGTGYSIAVVCDVLFDGNAIYGLYRQSTENRKKMGYTL